MLVFAVQAVLLERACCLSYLMHDPNACVSIAGFEFPTQYQKVDLKQPRSPRT